jgi:hypothetical protein
MKAKALRIAAIGVIAAALGATALAVAPSGTSAATAAVTKSLGAGGGAGSVSGAGSRFSHLLSGWAVPVLTVLAGCFLIGALLSRNIGTAIGVVFVTILGLIFLLAPSSIESLAKEIANTVL